MEHMFHQLELNATVQPNDTFVNRHWHRQQHSEPSASSASGGSRHPRRLRQMSCLTA